MNLFKKFFLIFFILLFGISKSYSDQKVAFIDLDFVFENSIPGKKILKELKDLNSQNINKLQSRENDLKIKEEEIKKKTKYNFREWI